MNSLNRREFVKQSARAVATVAVLTGPKAFAANEKVVIGVMGLGGRGTALAEKFSSRPDVEIAYLCDADTRRSARARDVVTKNQKRQPQLVQDFRRLLEDKSVDALVNATPDHWHALGTILGCQAGKDVYVEKPLSHNLWEGRKMIEAARKYQRVVQLGTQSRTAAYSSDAAAYIKAGKLGDIHLVRVFNMMSHPFVKAGPEQAVPPELDYELWCGPAPKKPYTPTRRWLSLWDYSCGAIAGDAVHQLDLARFLLGDPSYPKTVSHTGGIYALKDGRDTPDTQLATYEYDGFTLSFEATLWTPYQQKTPAQLRDKDVLPNWPFNGTRVEVFGTKGFMYFGRHGDGWQVFDENIKSVHSAFGRQADKEHIDNFIGCIRSRQRPHSDVEQGHYSTLLCHLANIAWRAGNAKLNFDAQTESFVNAPEANQYLKRTYRAPWVVPDQV